MTSHSIRVGIGRPGRVIPPMPWTCPCGRLEDIGLFYLCAEDCGNVVCTLCAARHPLGWIVCPECTNDGGD